MRARCLVAAVAAAFGELILISDPRGFSRLTDHHLGLRVLAV